MKTITRSQAALAAAAIKKELKQHFPNIKFSVTCQNYSMGDNVRVEYNDGVKRQKIEDIIGKYQYGHFDSMTDSYEYTNNRNDIPQTKYLHITRNCSDETRAKIIEVIKATYYGCENFNEDLWYDEFKCYGNTLIYRKFQEMEF